MGKDVFKFPLEISPVKEEISKTIMSDFLGERTGFVQVGPKKYFFPYKFLQEADHYYNTTIHEDDIWVVSFPRSGTTLTQELVWLISNDLNYEIASKIPVAQRFPFFEFGLFFHDDVKKELLKKNEYSPENQEMIENISKHGWEFLPELKSPRFIKSHFPISLLPKQWAEKKCKTIYVARNVKDVAVSFYYLNRLFKTQGFLGTFPKYWHYFRNNWQPWTPYWQHLEEAWNHRNDPNVLFLFYENIIEDMAASINSISTFLNKPRLNKEDLETLVEYFKFSNFKQKFAASENIFSDLKLTNLGEPEFFRKGKIGENCEEMDAPVKKEIHTWMMENMKRTNIICERWK